MNRRSPERRRKLNCPRSCESATALTMFDRSGGRISRSLDANSHSDAGAEKLECEASNYRRT